MTEKLSAWMDGELEVEHARELPSLLKRNAGLRGIWDCYHLIGDALRGVQGPDLRARICARLDSEPTALAPPRGSVAGKPGWLTLSAAVNVAAVVFVAFVGWTALPDLQQDAPQIALLPAPEVKQVAVPAGEGAKDYLFADLRSLSVLCSPA